MKYIYVFKPIAGKFTVKMAMDTYQFNFYFRVFHHCMFIWTEPLAIGVSSYTRILNRTWNDFSTRCEFQLRFVVSISGRLDLLSAYVWYILFGARWYYTYFNHFHDALIGFLCVSVVAGINYEVMFAHNERVFCPFIFVIKYTWTSVMISLHIDQQYISKMRSGAVVEQKVFVVLCSIDVCTNIGRVCICGAASTKNRYLRPLHPLICYPST